MPESVEREQWIVDDITAMDFLGYSRLVDNPYPYFDACRSSALSPPKTTPARRTPPRVSARSTA